ncbi:MAG TPA: rhomboid family intramembrane serine protease [Anaeromyxobacteraceae bacterium]|nr:rhomboid family intramembrane serine protease [Anaeromyxobacteraceae bacterium]
MARRRGLDLHRIVTLGETVPVAVGGILVAMLLVTVATMLSPRLWQLLCLDGPLIWRGQLWRLVTWVFPQGDPLTLLFAGFVLHWLGRDLANTWSEQRFLRVFFGYAAWAAACTALLSEIWLGADRSHVGAWPVVNALLVLWALGRPGAQLNLFGIVPMTGQVFAWLVVGGTVLFAVSAPTGAGEYVPHLAAIALALLMNAGVTPRRLWLRAKQGWYGARLRRGHLRPVPRDDRPKWMN